MWRPAFLFLYCLRWSKARLDDPLQSLKICSPKLPFSLGQHITASCTTSTIPLRFSSTSQSQNMATDDTIHTIRRLEGIQGASGKTNDIVYCGHPSKVPQGHTIFFGGDIQDYPEKMLAHRDNKRYVEYNVENTAQLLSKQLTENDIWLIKPNRMYLKTFSVFSNFVESSDIGNPDHSVDQGSWLHLSELLQNAMKVVRSTEQSKDTPVSLVGFSKGCVVLNQLLYDLSTAKSDEATMGFIKTVNDMYWLDGGHNGGSGVWITDDTILELLVDTGIRVHSHVTPYQMKDPMRKWIGKEQKKFVEKVGKFAKVTNKSHFADEERSIERHFDILKEFVNCQ